MNQHDQLVVELYRQAWETTRHAYTLLSSFTTVFALLTGAVLAFIAQARDTNDVILLGLLIGLAVLSLFGLQVTLRTSQHVDSWTKIQVSIQQSFGIGLPDYRPAWWGRISVPIGGVYFAFYLLVLIGLVLLMVLAGLGKVNLNDARGGAPTSKKSGTAPAPMAPPSSSLSWPESDCLNRYPLEFCNAMKDAQLAEPHEISKELVAITPYNKTLVWNGEPARSELLVVIWTRSPDYDTNVGRTMRLTREVWVTVVPQVKDFCAQLQPLADVSFRLKQLLGLHPDNEQTKFVELWVRQDDLFRPSPDPEVTDQEAELEFPRSPRFIWVAPEHVAWFTALLGKSYTKDGYPWTRLGYTYDWGNPKSKVGLSEFIIKEGSSVGIHAVSLTEEYCRPRAS